MPAATEQETYRVKLTQRLLQVTEAVIAGEGLAAVQARRIAREADCSVGTLYNIFGDVDGLILAASARTLSELGRVLTAAARRSASADLGGRLMALATAYLDFATVNQNRWRAVFETSLARHKPLPPTYLEDRRRLLALLGAQLESEITDPEPRSDAAHGLFYDVHGIVLLSLDAKLGPFEPDRCERQIRFVVDHVVKGLR